MRKLSKILVLVLVFAMMFTMASMFTASAASGTTWYVAGNSSYIGANWTANSSSNKMALSSGTTYTKQYTNVPTGNYEFKITNGTWGTSYGDNGGNYTFSLITGNSKNVTIGFNTSGDKIYVSATEFDRSQKAVVYIKNAANWSNVYVHSWSGDGGTSWPGTKATLVDSANKIYKVEISAGQSMIIFHNNSGTQTSNLIIPTNQCSLYNNSTKSWSTYHAATTTTTVDATCEAKGSVTETCNACGAVVSYSEISALGHNLVDVAGKDADCTNPGYTAYKDCSRCDYIEGKTVINAKNHTPAEAVQENVVSATCKAEGSYESVVKCSVCSAEISRTTETIEKLPHTEAVDAAVAATCTSTGLTEGKHCSVCNEVLVAQTVVDALDHSFVAGEVVAPTFEADGYTVYACTCGKTENRDIVPALVAVAQIGDVKYETLAEALEAAKAMTGDVVVEIMNKVTLNGALSGSFDSIKFVGKSADAEIYLDLQGYSEATGKKVYFEDLKLSKVAGGYIANAGFMNLAFGVFNPDEVTYTNCVFLNGAYACGGKATFDACTFYRSHDRYGMWAYGNVEITIKNSTFADFRGIKMYAEGGEKVTVLTVENTDFTAVNNKPAIVLTHGLSVTLSGNTYSETGVFELDLDGTPNGVTVTSDIAPTCKNDNGACGVLVDGKIYTTVAQAAAVATSDSTVTLLHNSAETVEFAEGVTLDKNGYTADGVTIKAPAVYVAQVGDVKYTSVIEALLAAAQNGAPEVKILQSVREKMPTDIEIIVNADLLITAYSAVELKFYNDGTNYDFIFNSNNNNTITIGENVTFQLEDRVIWLGYYGNNVDVVVNGTFAAYQIWHGADTTVNATGTIKTTGEALVMRRGATLTVNGGKVEANYFNILAGNIFAENATINCGAFWIANTGSYAGEGNVSISIWESTLTSSGNFKSSTSNTAGVTFDVYESVVKFNDFDGYGACQLDANTTLFVNGENAELTIKSLTNNGTIDVYDNGTFNVTGNATNNGTILLEAGSSIAGPENMGVEVEADGKIVEYQDGKYVVVDAPKVYVAQIGDVQYESLEEAAAAAKSGDEIILLADVSGDVTLPAGIIFNGNGYYVDGILIADGDITFKNVTKANDLDFNKGNVTVNIGEGASLQLVGANRMSIGFGITFNITGTITDAKTADVSTLTPSLVLPGASFTGAGVTFNVNNAYVKVPSSYASSSKSASGTFDFNIINSIWESAGKLAFEAQSVNATVNFELKDSVLTTGSHLVFGVSNGEIVIDNSNVNVGTSRQIENRSTMIVKNGSVVNGAVARSSNAQNPGTLIVDNATYAVTGEFTGADLGSGRIVLKNGAHASIPSITETAVELDATSTLTTNSADLAIETEQGYRAVYENGAYTLIKVVAKIGDTYYQSLEEAFKAATSGCTIEILDNVTVDYYWDARFTGAKFTVPVTINGNGHTIKFTNTVYDGGNYMSAFRFEADATVTNLTIDMSEALSGFATRIRAISAKTNLTVDGCTFIGNGASNNTRAIIFGEGSSARSVIKVTNSVFSDWRFGVIDNESGKDVATSVEISGNTFTNSNVNVSAATSTVFNNNVMNNGYVKLVSYSADNVLSVEATGNTLTETSENYIFAKEINAQDGFETKHPAFKVATKAELNAALAVAQEGDTIILTADINYGSDQLKIEKAITLDLGGFTLTTANNWGGMSVKGNPTIKNGTIVHTGNTAAIKVWNAVAFEDLTIDVSVYTEGKVKGGIVLQSGSTTRVDYIKNVTIKGAGLTNGIETYNCGDAAQDVIGAMENVTIKANGTGMLISAPCGTATNCTIEGGANAIEISIKGNYSASLDLVDCDVTGGVYAHDEFSSAPVVNNGTLNFTADEATTGADIEDVTLTINNNAENVVGILKEIKDNAKAQINGTYYATLAEAIAAAQAGETVYVFAGTYAVPSMKAGIAIEGVGEVLFEGTLSGTLENLTLKNLHIKGGNAQRWAYAKGDLVFENVTFEATSVYALHFDGITEGATLLYKDCTIIGWAAMSGSPASVVFDGCTIKGNGSYGLIRTYFDATIQNCTFDVSNVNPDDIYQDGIHAVDATVTVNNCTNVNGDMKDIIDTDEVGYVVLDGETIHIHKFVAGETVAPTFTSEGYTPYTCPCGETERRDIVPMIPTVAVIGEVRFATLAEAFAAANTGDTIVLQADVSLSETITVPAGMGIVLDLNGNTINADLAEGSTTNHIYVFTNNGTLLLKGNGVINTRGIYNYGNLTLANGTINAIDANGGYGVINYTGSMFVMNGGKIATTLEDGDLPGAGYDATTVAVKAGATFIMNGGEIENISNYTFAIDNSGTTTINNGKIYSVHTTIGNSGDLTVNGGEFTCDGLEGITAHVVWAEEGTTTINGGTFNGKDNYNGFNVDASEGAVVNITGGNFLNVHSGSLYGEGTIAVSGGKFFDDVSNRLADGYTIISGTDENGNTVYGVMEEAKVPYIKDGYWWIDGINTGIKAEGTDGEDGEDGVTPTLKIEDGHVWVSYDNGATWTDLGNIMGSDGEDGTPGTPGADGEDGVTPKLKIEGGILYVSYDNGATWEELGNIKGENGADGKPGQDGSDGEDGEDGEDGKDGITPIFKIEDGHLWVSYDNEATWKDLGNIKGADGSNGSDGSDGSDGEDGVTPTLKIENGHLWVSYDNGATWEDLGNIKGEQGDKGEQGEPGKDGVTPTLKLEGGHLWVSYDNGATWTDLGNVTGSDGNDGNDGQPGQNGEDGADGKPGIDGITPMLKVENGHLMVSYNNGATWEDLGNIKGDAGNDGTNGQPGADGKPGQDGADGITPIFKIDNGHLWVSYDNEATWKDLGNIQGANGENGSNGSAGENGQPGEDGKDGITPQLRINPETNEWEVSYDNGETWTSLGVKATGDKGEQGDKGDKGDDGENMSVKSFFNKIFELLVKLARFIIDFIKKYVFLIK